MNCTLLKVRKSNDVVDFGERKVNSGKTDVILQLGEVEHGDALHGGPHELDLLDKVAARNDLPSDANALVHVHKQNTPSCSSSVFEFTEGSLLNAMLNIAIGRVGL